MNRPEAAAHDEPSLEPPVSRSAVALLPEGAVDARGKADRGRTGGRTLLRATPDFLRRNPAGKVPILKMGNRVMSESQAICEYLEEIAKCR